MGDVPDTSSRHCQVGWPERGLGGGWRGPVGVPCWHAIRGQRHGDGTMGEQYGGEHQDFRGGEFNGDFTHRVEIT